ncbi:MarR family winged helix-turn-helix transcriptional regulator [Microbacterium sp.]|uniref:MarR family winged helix-turn-helix transcriptional regulator n=1 Tax=Microbacterium sp. TaxID=51671 RepID=UPI003C75D687
MNTSDTHPFGYWITAVDRLMRTEFATLFDDEGITRRDWRMLNRIDGTVPSERPVHSAKLRRLVELGWVQRTRDGWALTDAGTLAKQRLGTAVDELRARVAGAVSPEDYATMTASLEKIAREFSWAEGKRLPRREGRGHGHRGGHCHEAHHDRRFHDHGHRPGSEVHHGVRFGEHGDRHRDLGPHAHHAHGFPRHHEPTTHIHIHTHG